MIAASKIFMKRFSLTKSLSRFFDIRPGESRRVGLMVSLLFFLLAANNVIKVARDSLFLSHFSIDHLPYVYLLAAVFAGLIIAVYSRYTSRLPLYRLILDSNVFIISNIIAFWVLIVFFKFGWLFTPCTFGPQLLVCFRSLSFGRLPG